MYSPEDFKPIDNPYAAVADGGPVPVTSHMFYGREDFIKNVADSIIKAPSKQVIIYGQKRCGKSSVMLHLKERLMSTGKAFCIFFSLGEIINNLTEAAFYHKILSTIQLELEALELDGLDIPNVEFPKYHRANKSVKVASRYKSFLLLFHRFPPWIYLSGLRRSSFTFQR